jgi:predicted negative regulator of RcsB-dependent stress response
MEMIVEAIKDLWKNNRKVVIGAGVVVAILIIAAL